MKFLRTGCLVLALGAYALPATAQLAPPSAGVAAGDARPAFAQAPAPRAPDVPYDPTPHNVVAQMLRLAQVREGDVVYDLGCGDGRV